MKTSRTLAVLAGVALTGLAACSNTETPLDSIPDAVNNASAYGECAQQYAALTSEVLQDQSVTSEQQKVWRERASQGASAAASGDPNTALELCQETVVEMQEILGQ